MIALAYPNSRYTACGVRSANGIDGSASGTAPVDGTNSIWTNAGSLFVGHDGTGTLNIQNGGSVSNTTGYITRNGGDGDVTVTGAGSMWTNSGSLFVGYDGLGLATLDIVAGGTVTNANAAGSDWFTFEHRLRNNGDDILEAILSLYDANGGLLWSHTLVNLADIVADPNATVGGRNYGWFALLDLNTGGAQVPLRVDDMIYENPEPTTGVLVTAGLLGLMRRRARKNN